MIHHKDCTIKNGVGSSCICNGVVKEFNITPFNWTELDGKTGKIYIGENLFVGLLLEDGTLIVLEDSK